MVSILVINKKNDQFFNEVILISQLRIYSIVYESIPLYTNLLHCIRIYSIVYEFITLQNIETLSIMPESGPHEKYRIRTKVAVAYGCEYTAGQWPRVRYIPRPIPKVKHKSQTFTFTRFRGLPWSLWNIEKTHFKETK